MKYLLYIGFTLLILGCKNENQSELTDILTAVRSNNKIVFEKINATPSQDSLTVEMKSELERFHRAVNSFIDSVDQIENNLLISRTNAFINRTFKKYILIHPPNLEIRGSTPTIIKLQIANLESCYIREPDAFYVKFPFIRFDSIFTIIVPDHYYFKSNEQVTGLITLGVYSKSLGEIYPTIKLNDKIIPIESGMARFSFSPNELGFHSGQKRLQLKGEIVMDSFTSSATTSILIEE